MLKKSIGVIFLLFAIQPVAFSYEDSPRVPNSQVYEGESSHTDKVKQYVTTGKHLLSKFENLLNDFENILIQFSSYKQKCSGSSSIFCNAADMEKINQRLINTTAKLDVAEAGLQGIKENIQRATMSIEINTQIDRIDSGIIRLNSDKSFLEESVN